MWSNFYAEGGWGMHPIALFGLLLVASAVLYLIRPERRFVPVTVSLGVATLGAGVLGTAVGIAKTLHYLHQVPVADQVKVGSAGVAESLHDIVFALILVVLSALLASIGALRAARSGAAEASG